MVKNDKYSNIIILLNNLINIENIFKLLDKLYQQLENYHNLVIIFQNGNGGVWEFISKIVVTSENLKNIDIKNFDIINKKRKKLIEKTLEDIDYNYYKTEIKDLFEQYYQKIFYGYYFEDLFISEKDNIKILILKKIAPEFEKISCPVCNSLKVSGNSYHKNFIKSFECKNPECPAKSVSGRGKRFDKLSVKKNKYKTNENKINVNLKKEFRKDIFNSNQILKMLLSFYSWNNDKILFLTDKKNLKEKEYYYKINSNNKRIIILNNTNKYIHRNDVDIKRFKENILYDNIKKYLIEYNQKINVKNIIKHTDKNVVLYNGNSKYIIPYIKDNIDYIITSPPYYNVREYSQWNNFNTFLLDMLIYGYLFKQKLKNNGYIFFNIGDISCKDNIYFTSRTSKRHLSLFSYITYIWNSIGLYLIDNIIWDKGEVHSKRNSTNNLYPYYLYPINVYEHILVFSKKRKNFISNKPNILKLTPVIKINNKKINKIKHTAPYPEKLVEFIIKKYNINEKNIILDPFMGSGTTGKVARKFNIQFIGIELNKEYFELSKKNILKVN